MNRQRIRRTGLAAAVFAAWSLACAATAMASEEQAASAKPPSGAETMKEVAIMSRILETRLGDELAEGVFTANMFQRGVQGFHVPGVGALFFADVKFAVAAPPETEPREAPDPNDLWQRFERQLEGKPEAVHRGMLHIYDRGHVAVAEQPTVDKDKIARLKQTIFEVLANYGERMESLGPDDRIIVLVNGDGRSAPLISRTFVSPIWEDGKVVVSPEMRVEQARKTINSAVDEKAAVGDDVLATMALDREDPLAVCGSRRSALIIQVRCRDLVDAPKDLAEKARVEAYCY